MKTAAFWDIRLQFLPHRKYIAFPLQRTTGCFYKRFEVYTAVTMKTAAFLDIRNQYVPYRRYINSLLQSPAG
jgi:hypothetical protein